MKIAVAGPYSAPNEILKALNLKKLNLAAFEIYKLGHIPIIGLNIALPISQYFPETEQYNVIMNISLEAVRTCDALYLLAESPGANRERDLMAALGKPIYLSIDEIPMPSDIENKVD